MPNDLTPQFPRACWPLCFRYALSPATAWALLLMHHSGKAETRVGLAARDSAALLGHVDISIDMQAVMVITATPTLSRRKRVTVRADQHDCGGKESVPKQQRPFPG